VEQQQSTSKRYNRHPKFKVFCTLTKTKLFGPFFFTKCTMTGVMHLGLEELPFLFWKKTGLITRHSRKNGAQYFDIALSVRPPASVASTVIDWHRWPQRLAPLKLCRLIPSFGGKYEKIMITFLTSHHLTGNQWEGRNCCGYSYKCHAYKCVDRT
jgi:hypothetical protein